MSEPPPIGITSVVCVCVGGGAISLLYYVIKTGNLTAANGKSPSASNYYYRVYNFSCFFSPSVYTHNNIVFL